MSDNILVSLIIRAYNEEKHIVKLLRLISQQKVDFDYEVIVVDSGSTDNTVRIAKDFGAKMIYVQPDKFSFGYSLNKGMESAKGKYCVMISAHCFPLNENWLNEIIKPFEYDNKIALVYGKQRGVSSSKFSEKEIFNKWYPNKNEGIQNTPFCNNANAVIRRELWEEFKYDETLTGLEDIEWAKRLMDNGYYIYYNPKAEVEHLHKETWQQIYNRYKRESIAFYKIFPGNKFSFFMFIKFLVLNIIMDFYHCLKRKKICFHEIILFRYNQFKGTYEGAKIKDNITKELKNIFYYPNKIL